MAGSMAQRDLQRAVENLYSVFSPYHLRPHIEGCSCCTSDADNELLRSKPLRKLDEVDLYGFAASALYTRGDVSDLKHFLPRLLELAAAGRLPLIDASYVTTKLPHARWRNWPEREQAAVRAYLEAGWRLAMSYSPPRDPWEYYAVDGWLEAIAASGEDLLPFLFYWRDAARNSDKALLYLARLVNEDAMRIRNTGALRGVSTKHDHEQAARVVLWLREPRTLDTLTDGFFEHPAGSFGDELSRAVDMLGML